ncbi:MAG: hypothetical protein ACI31D_02780, partial [Candidatus Limisoma sp.]
AGTPQSFYGNSGYICAYSSCEGERYTITTFNYAESRTASCTVNVEGDPSKVQFILYSSNEMITLNEGANTVRFIPDVETPATISPAVYGTELYSVTVNDEPAQAQGTQWVANLTDGCTVNIKTDFPNVDFPIHFVYSEGAEGFVQGVVVNENPVDNFNDSNFAVKAGSKVVIYGDVNNYQLNSFKVNDSTVSFYSSYEFTVKGETTISIDATKYAMVNAVINVDNPDNVTVYRGYSYNNDIISLVAGNNNIELSSKNAMIQVKANSGCYLVSVSDGENEYKDSSNPIYVTEGMTITIQSGAIVRDKTAVIYFDDLSAANYYYSFQRSDRSTIDVANGYNTFAFYDGDNDFQLGYAGVSALNNVYKNDEPVSPMYEGSSTFTLNFADKDVVKVYMNSTPELKSVRFTTKGDASVVSVVKDIIIPVENWTDGFTALEGTQVALSATGHKLDVTVNGTAVEPDSEGAYIFTVGADNEIEVAIDDNGGVAGLAIDKKQDNNVYNLQGIMVIRNATKADIENLPKGIYIINNKKVVR